MKEYIKRTVKLVLDEFGYELQHIGHYPVDFRDKEVHIIEAVEDYTMTSEARVYSLINAVQYIARNHVPGAIAECGVWRGGSMMAAAMALQEFAGNPERDLYLFDTFEGMTTPSEEDINAWGERAEEKYKQKSGGGEHSSWAYSPLEEVKHNMAKTDYNGEYIHFVKGRVENTLPREAPDQLALLRLDTDWYESTLHELEQLYPRIASGGVLIIDDYGHWEGSKRAVDEYVEKNNLNILLNRIDYAGRIGVKR